MEEFCERSLRQKTCFLACSRRLSPLRCPSGQRLVLTETELVTGSGETLSGDLLEFGVRCGRLHIHLAQSEIFDGEWAVVCPDDVREHSEDAVKIDSVRLCQAHAQQVQTQIGVGSIRGGRVQIAYGEDRDAPYPACVGLFADESVEPVCRAVGW